MRDRGEPWKWPVSIGLSVGLMLAVALWLPRSWLGFLLVPRAPNAPSKSVLPQRWLTLFPPLEIEVFHPDLASVTEPEPAQPFVQHEDPRWWQDGWAVSTVDEILLAPPLPALADTVRMLLGELGLGVDFMTRARPDSVLAARLFMLQVEDGFRYEELKPFLASVSRAKAYAAILSRAADMYDEHLAQEIQVTD